MVEGPSSVLEMQMVFGLLFIYLPLARLNLLTAGFMRLGKREPSPQFAILWKACFPIGYFVVENL